MTRLTWEPKGTGEGALITVWYRNPDGSKIAGRSMREMLEAGVAPDGRWALVYRMAGMKPQSMSGQADSMVAAKLACIEAIPNFARGLYIAGNRIPQLYGPASGGIIGQI